MIKYDISNYGFLPESCITVLPLDFSYVNNIVADLKHPAIRDIVNMHMPKKTPDIFSLTKEEKKYLYSVLCMIVHRYVWCDIKNPAQIIPYHIGKIWLDVSNDLGIVPVLTHAAVDLWNWQLINPSMPFSLDNLRSINLMLDNESNATEQWFYLDMVAIEGIGAKSLYHFHNIINEINSFRDNEKIYESFIEIINNFKEITVIMKRMYEKCDPKIFFHKLRIYLNGYNKTDIFPNGLHVEGFPDIELKYTGGSAAQSSLIQAFDIFLSVKHDKSGDKNCSGVFLDRMRDYMPTKHREYLEYIETISPNISDYVSNSNDEYMKELYTECIHNLVLFRSAHISLVHTHIVKLIRNKKDNSVDEKTNNASGTEGTAGTEPYKFCKSIIDETRNTKLQNPFILLYIILFFIIGVASILCMYSHQQ